MKAKLLISLALPIAVLGLALSLSTPSSALVGASQPTNCGAVRGTQKITAHTSTGALIKTVDTAAKYYTSQAPGVSNNCVKDIQKMMNASYCTVGTKLVVDGSYGTKTKTAVTKMQTYLKGYNFRVNGAALIVDGKVGPQTWSLLSTPGIDARFNPCS